MFNAEPTINEIADKFVQAKHLVHECEVECYRGNHPYNRYARGQVARARNLAKKHGVKICPICKGKGYEMTRDTPIVLPCDWCGATGYDEKREETCWKCKGNRVTVYSKFHPHVCHNCGGARGFKETK